MNYRPLLVLDAAVPALVAAVIVVGEALGGSGRPAAAVLGAAAAAALYGRRRFPAATLAASALAVAALFHLDQAAGVVALIAPAVALYSLALRRGRPAQLLAGVAAVGAVIMADVLSGGSPTVLQTLSHVLLVSIPLLAAEAIRAHRSYLQVLQERVELAERSREQEARQRTEQERLRIARELHDLVAHTLTEINVQAGAAAERLEAGVGRAALERIEDASHRAIGELRAVLGVLRDPQHAGAPLLPAPGVMDVPDLVSRARDAGLDACLQVAGEQPPRLSDGSSLAAYRIIQESLTNARRHAPGAPVTVGVTFGGERMSILVQNPSAGRDHDDDTVAGVGLQGMYERATAAGGILTAGHTRQGFTVHADLPYLPPR
ncbi:MAG TPA: histidine kinase [Trebonia sp.]|jgi:signal transduction histidine kinase|nr:histidine kinase [Trebonia sp.]